MLSINCTHSGRRGWDSNSRYGQAVNRISSPSHLPPDHRSVQLEQTISRAPRTDYAPRLTVNAAWSSAGESEKSSYCLPPDLPYQYRLFEASPFDLVKDRESSRLGEQVRAERGERGAEFRY
jgi:hypothetical protein